jgi:hypothetical protein
MSDKIFWQLLFRECIGCSFKFIHHELEITDQLFKSNLTFCVVYVFTLQTDEWCVHNRLLNANFEDTFK